MKNGNPCPKCGHKEIAYIPGGLLKGQQSVPLGFWGFTRVRIATLVCKKCGFVENWTDQHDDLGMVQGVSSFKPPAG